MLCPVGKAGRKSASCPFIRPVAAETKPGGNPITSTTLTRRRLLQVGAGELVTTTILGGSLTTSTAATATPCDAPFTWISPCGTIEVMDDYPYWVAREIGYFGILRVETAMEPGPSDGTAVVKFLAVEQADIGSPSPGVLSFAVNYGMDLVSGYGSCLLQSGLIVSGA